MGNACWDRALHASRHNKLLGADRMARNRYPPTAPEVDLNEGATAVSIFTTTENNVWAPAHQTMQLLKPSKAWAIVDERDLTVMEASGSGHLNIFYDRSDAEAMLPAVKRGAEKATAKRLIVIEVYLSR